MADKRRADIPLRGKNSGGDFERSLEELKAEDIPVLTERKFKGKNKKLSDIIQFSIIGICAIVFVVALVLIINNLSDKKRGNEIYGEASDLIKPITLNDASTEAKGDANVMTPYERIEAMYGGEDISVSGNEYNLDLAPIKASLSSLRQLNDEVTGWIYVENSRINYPLMRSSTGYDEYYLTHAYTGEYLAVGSIYLVGECSPVLTENYNSLIYGHNVVNGSMFHDVTKFFDPEFFANSYIYIYTFDGAYIYKPFSVYETLSDYNYIQTSFENETEFLEFAERVAGNSEVPCDEKVKSGDTIITLSTCTNGGVNGPGRYALHAKLVAFVE
ncbi:MAG: sortase [Ruminococcaceae bacterium]|nr:sortase [Oscillospiraceae bacterium]